MSQSEQHALTPRLGESLTEGSVVDPATSFRGTFTLDPEIARARIRHARFANPVHYVLELVQAAVRKGATRISFRFEQGDLQMDFDGEPFAPSDYEQLYTSLLLRADSHTAQARQLLALGLCTGLQLDPALIRVESGTSFVELRPGQPDLYGALDTSIEHTRIRVHERLGLGLLRRYVDHLGGHLTEELLLQERCRYARIPIELDGKLISHDHSLPELPLFRRFTVGDVCGAVGILPYPGADSTPPPEAALSPTVLTLIKCGVVVDTQLPLELLPGFHALIESSAFHMDTSREHVVDDAEYASALQQVLRAQIELLAALSRRYLAPPTVTAAEPVGIHHLRALVRGLLQQLGGIMPLLGWAHLPLHAFRLADLPVSSSVWPTEVADGAALLEVPIWQSTTGELISLARLLRDFASYQTVAYSAVRSDGLTLDRPLIVHTAGSGDKELLQSLFGKALTAHDTAIQQAWEREHNKAAWQRRPHRPRLTGQVVIVRVPLVGPNITGEVGIEPHRIARTPWKRQAERPGLLRFLFIKDGSLLAEKKVPFPVPDLTVAVAADFTPSYRFDDVLSDAQLTAVIDALFNALPALIEQVCQLPLGTDPAGRAGAGGGGDLGRSLPWRASVLRPLFVLALSARARQAARRAMGDTASEQPEERRGSPHDDSLSTPPHPDEATLTALWRRLEEWPIFESLDGTPLCLTDLLAAGNRDGYLAVLCPKAPLASHQLESWAALCQQGGAPAAVWQQTHDYSPVIAPVGERPAFVIWLNPGEQALVELLTERLPGLRIVDAEQWLRAVAMMAALYREHAATWVAPTEGSDGPISLPPAVASSALYSEAVPQEITPEPRFPPPELLASCPPVATAEDRLVAAVVDELHGHTPQGGTVDRLRESVNLAWLQFGEDPRPLAVVCDSQKFILNRNHPVVQQALDQSPADPLLVGCLASAAYTALNARLVAASDEDAARFLHQLAVRATTPDRAWESTWYSEEASAL